MKEVVDMLTICHRVSESTGISFQTLNASTKHIFRAIRSILESQQEVDIPDFGRFTFKHRRAKISTNVNGGPDTYTPANSKLIFIPDTHWESWQRIHSSQIPDQLPPGTQLGTRLGKSKHVRTIRPDLAADNTDPFYTQFLVEKAKRKASNNS